MIHSGSASGGHYYVYIKDFEKEKWFCFDDQSVTSVSIWPFTLTLLIFSLLQLLNLNVLS